MIFMAWCEFDFYSLLRFCGALAVLIVVYYLLFDRKARFRHCRYFLLSAVFVAGVAGVLRIPVYVPEQAVVLEFAGMPGGAVIPGGDSGGETVAVKASGTEVPAGNVELPVKGLEMPEVAEEIAGGGVEPEVVEEEKGWSRYAEDAGVWWLVYVVVTVVLALRWLLAMAGIMRLKRWGSCYEQDGCLVVRNNRVASPFSFFKMIFVNRKLEGEALEVVLSHERSHVEHRHYVDMLLMELFCVVFWFNPFVWLVRRELRALHEFEVDQCLLSGGIELSKYQHIIFDELMGYGPRIANGFHNSLIKKRFIMMKDTNTIRFRFVRKVALVPVIAGVVALFAFTDREVVVKQVAVPELPEVAELPEPVEFSIAAEPADAEKLFVADVAEKDAPELPERKKKSRPERLVAEETPDVAGPVNELKEEGSVAADEELSDTRPPYRGVDGMMLYPLSESQVVVSFAPFRTGRTVIRYIEAGQEDTRVTIAVPVVYDSQWIQFDKGFCIVDQRTGDAYMLRSMTRGIELNKLYSVEGHKNRMVEFTMVFPPLKRQVKFFDMYQKFPEMKAPEPSNATPWVWRNLSLEAYAPPVDKDRFYDREGRPRTERKVRYVDLRDDQVVVSTLPGANGVKLRSIVTSDKDTRVTFAVPIYYDRHWVQFDKGYCIEDCRTGEVYRIQALDRGIELNKTSIVVGKKGKVVEFTMIFPPLNKKVKRVNLYTKFPEEGALAPVGAGPDWAWFGIRPADYAVVRGEVIY